MMDGGFEPAAERLAAILLPVFQALRGEFEARLATFAASAEIRSAAADRALAEARRAVAEVANKLPVLQSLPRDFARQVAELREVSDAHATAAELALAELRAKPPTMPLAQPYYPSRSYRPGEMAIYASGLWQAQVHTTAPPGDATSPGDWGLVVDGLATVSAEQDCDEPRLFRLVFEMTSGLTERVQLSLLSGPEGPPGMPGLSLAGPPGRGIVGWKSPEPGKIQLIFDDDELSEPIEIGGFRFCGTYKPGTSYRYADIVRFGYSLWIALKPTGTVPSQQSSSDWSLFLPGVEPGGVGGGGGGTGGNYLPISGGTLSGQLALPDGNPVNVALRLGPDTSGFYYDPTGGMIIVCNPPGSAAMGWTATEIASGRDINMFDHLMTRLRDPVSPQDAATKAYVDAHAGGGGDFLPLVGGLLTGPLVMISSAGADAEIGITVGGRQAQIYWGNALVMRRGTANESVYIENNNGSNRSEVLTQLLGDARYLQSADATARFLPITGGVMTGILSFAANQGIVFGPLASVIYEDPTTLRLRKTSNNADPTIEDNGGVNRTRIVTELIADANYVRKDFGVMTGALLCTGGTGTTPGLMIGDNNTGFLRPSGIMLQLLVGGALVFTYTAAALFPGAAISMNNQHISGLPTPLVPGDAAPKSYVDSQIAGITAATAFRTQVWQPGDVVIPAGQVAPTLMLDVNFSLPAVGLRSLLITIDPLFRSNVPSGAQWSLVYTCPMLTPGGLGEVPMVVYKMTNDDYGMLLSTAKFNVVVDASSGSVRIQIYVACPTHQSGLPSITQAGSGNVRSLVTVQDLGLVT